MKTKLIVLALISSSMHAVITFKHDQQVLKKTIPSHLIATQHKELYSKMNTFLQTLSLDNQRLFMTFLNDKTKQSYYNWTLQNWQIANMNRVNSLAQTIINSYKK